MLFWRPIPGFEPSPGSYTLAQHLVEQTRADLATAARQGELARHADTDEAFRLFTSISAGLCTQQLANEPDATYESGLFTSLTDQAADDAVMLQGAQVLGEHLLRDAFDAVEEIAEPGGCPLGHGAHDQHRPAAYGISGRSARLVARSRATERTAIGTRCGSRVFLGRYRRARRFIVSYALSIDLVQPFEDVVPQVKQALADNGFGIVAEIDMQKTLKNKIGVEIEPHLILGACNPRFANRALQVEPSIGLLLPCNVVIRHAGELTVVEAINPETLVTLTGNPAMAALAHELTAALNAALDTLRDTA